MNNWGTLIFLFLTTFPHPISITNNENNKKADEYLYSAQGKDDDIMDLSDAGSCGSCAPVPIIVGHSSDGKMI